MPKRSQINLEDVADWDNLVRAVYRAARGRRMKTAVRDFHQNMEANLVPLRNSLLDGTIPVGCVSTFHIMDPKRRVIHAPVFRERVLHHALMNQIGPVLEKSLVADTFACRIGKGVLAAVKRAQHHSQRYAWFGKLDIRQYFPSICHATLLEMLTRKFKDRRLLELLARIIDSCHCQPGRGLPIGALTSQNFANFYMNPLDRFLLEESQVRGIVRYMDDVVWWCDSKDEVEAVGVAAEQFLLQRLSLQIRPPIELNHTKRGIPICGFRVFPGTILLSRRRRKLYRLGRRKWEARFEAGLIDSGELQSAYAAMLGITLHADASAWRRGELERHPPLESCEEI